MSPIAINSEPDKVGTVVVTLLLGSMVSAWRGDMGLGGLRLSEQDSILLSSMCAMCLCACSHAFTCFLHLSALLALSWNPLHECPGRLVHLDQQETFRADYAKYIAWLGISKTSAWLIMALLLNKWTNRVYEQIFERDWQHSSLWYETPEQGFSFFSFL